MPKIKSIMDWRAFRRKEDRRLMIVIMAFLVVGGGTAIGLVYGWHIAAGGVACLAGGAGVLGLLWLILVLVERWAERE